MEFKPQIPLRKSCGASINEQLRHHIEGIEDWRFQEAAAFLHEWAQRFNEVFALQVPTPAIQLERLSPRRLGTYRPSRNGFGLEHEISFNTRYLDQPPAEWLDTCLHELLHGWQKLHGRPPSPRSGNYHNVEFRRKAHSYGLLVDDRGRSLGVEPGPFTELIERYGISSRPLVEAPQPAPPRRSGASKLKKWSCGCTNVRSAVVLRALCLQCGQEFAPAPPAW